MIITDKLGRYEAAQKEVLPRVEHRRHTRWNNRADNVPTRPANGNEPCASSSRPVRPNGFALPLGLFVSSSVRDAVACVRWTTAANGSADSSCGTREHDDNWQNKLAPDGPLDGVFGLNQILSRTRSSS